MLEIGRHGDQETITDVNKLGSLIPRNLWVAFILREAWGYSWEDIGFAVDCSPAVAHYRHHHAKLRLTHIVYKEQNRSE